MNPNVGKVIAKSIFHVSPQRKFERPTRAGKDAAYVRRCFIRHIGRVRRGARDAPRTTVHNWTRRRHCDHFICNPVGLSFQRIVDRADGHLSLKALFL
ncbi:MAG TPA: hypothetical protein VFZ51_01375 [Woeseiaceae bacterium]